MMYQKYKDLIEKYYAAIRRVKFSLIYGPVKTKFIGKNITIVSRDKFEIGNNIILGHDVVLENGNGYGIYIGKDVSIARDCYIRTSNHKMSDISVPISEQGHQSTKINFKKDEYSIVIEDDVWIGAKCIILSGAHIGKGSVISAGSIISSSKIPEYSIASGNPAKVISFRK